MNILENEPMATTSLTLSDEWSAYLKEQVETGEYATVSDVIRDALRDHRVRQQKLDALRAHLDQGLSQLDRGETVELPTPKALVARAEARRANT